MNFLHASESESTSIAMGGRSLVQRKQRTVRDVISQLGHSKADPTQPNAKVFSSSSTPCSRGRSWSIEWPLLLPMRSCADTMTSPAMPRTQPDGKPAWISWACFPCTVVASALPLPRTMEKANRISSQFTWTISTKRSWCTSRSLPLRQRFARLPPPCMSLSQLGNPEATRQRSF